MATLTKTSPLTNFNPDEWELVNDDGFVYNRKKRRLDPTALVRVPDPGPDPDPAAEIKQQRKRKRQALLQLKDKYQKEISLWEQLSNTLKAMEESAKIQLAQNDRLERNREIQHDKGVHDEIQSGSLLDQVLLQVEAQEAIIRHCSYICDAVESLCSAHEEKAKLHLFIDLPIWDLTESPHELLASLCED